MSYRIPLVKPLLPDIKKIEPDLIAMFRSGRLSNFGPNLQQLERRTADYLNVSHSIAVSSATTGLCLLLNTLPKNKEVIVPSFTFLPTVQAVVWNRLIPRFVDVDPHTFCLDTDEVERAVGPNTAAILAVNVFGAPCEVDKLEDIARSQKLSLFFDSAHAFGSLYRGEPVGGFGDAEVFSFSATKVLPAGEGGLVTTNLTSIRDEIIRRRNYGLTASEQERSTDASAGRRDCRNMGLNGKMTEFASILCLSGLDEISDRIRKRNEIAQRYRDRLSSLPALSFQHIRDRDISTYKDFTIVLNARKAGIDRDGLIDALKANGIEAGRYFYPPVHKLTYFQRYARDTYLPHTEVLSKSILSVPIYSLLQDEEVQQICDTIEGSLCTRIQD